MLSLAGAAAGLCPVGRGALQGAGMQSCKQEGKNETRHRKKNIQSENNWAEQASRGGSCTAEGSDKPESQRSDDEIVCAMPACSQTPRGERRAAPQALPTTTHPTCRRQPDTSAVWVSSQQQRITAHAHLEKLSFLPPVKAVHRNALC